MTENEVVNGQRYLFPKNLIRRLKEDKTFTYEDEDGLVKIEIADYQPGYPTFAINVYATDNINEDVVYKNQFSSKGYYYINKNDFFDYFNGRLTKKDIDKNDYKYIYEIAYLNYHVVKGISNPDGLVHKHIGSNEQYFVNDIVFVTSKSNKFTIAQIVKKEKTSTFSKGINSFKNLLYDTNIVCLVTDEKIIDFLSLNKELNDSMMNEAKKLSKLDFHKLFEKYVNSKNDNVIVEYTNSKSYTETEKSDCCCSCNKPADVPFAEHQKTVWELEQAKQIVYDLNVRIHNMENELKYRR